ncbi:auxin-responsive protein SAUR64-like [Telopea speciosissima]|uniref:auxin-responsive protein SAUR64-like n=1 Tax=Telopea speciosissima TaxID=54955 RepID=UPI001CC4D4FA|nr:auxin-responsive protein SAUR64-like [Telopea speciosissima]
MMINTKRLMMKMARKWRIGTAAAIGRKRITLPNKGNFVVYTTDESRFMIPLEFLSNNIFRELFKMAEEEFGLEGSSGPITLPCDSVFMKYIVSLVQGNVSRDLEMALLVSIPNGPCGASSSTHSLEQSHQQTLLTMVFEDARSHISIAII